MEINPEREKVLDKLEKMINFFRHAEIKNDDSLININEQLDDVMSSLKYIPSEPSFDSLPTEIKTNILNYLCDTGAFIAASVSQEWMQILKRNLKQVDEISLGKHCSNGDQSVLLHHLVECEDKKCFMPEEFLTAAFTHNLDVPLSICHPLRNINTELIVKGLTSVSNLSIKGDCDCNEEEPPILYHQLQALFKELEEKGKIMDSLQLIDINLKLTGMNQGKLVNYLLNKVKNLTVDDSLNGAMLEINEQFIKSLLQITTESQLSCLTLRSFEYPDSDEYPNLAKDLVDALCKVPSVVLIILPDGLEKKTAKRLFRNIRTQNIRMKSFELDEEIDWRGVLSPGKLKKTLEKMDKLKLVGKFTAAQVEAAKSLPGVEANLHKISKSSISED